MYDPASHGLFKRLWAAVRLRCPRCCVGAAWAAPFRMNTACPECGLVFEREPGYFVGAMYAGYAFSLFGTLPVWMWMLFAGAGIGPILLVTALLLLVIMPVTFHLARSFWMHIDAYFNPKTFERT